MKILYLSLALAFTALVADTLRGDEIPLSPNLNVHLIVKPHLIGTHCAPCPPSEAEIEKELLERTSFYRENPWAVAENWQDFASCPNYVRTHQDICEAAGFKSRFSLVSYLHPLFAYVPYVSANAAASRRGN